MHTVVVIDIRHFNLIHHSIDQLCDTVVHTSGRVFIKPKSGYLPAIINACLESVIPYKLKFVENLDILNVA